MPVKPYTLDALDAAILNAAPTPPAGQRFVRVDARILAALVADSRALAVLLPAATQVRDVMKAPGFKSVHPDGQPFAVADAYQALATAIVKAGRTA